jgi:16S rRNA (cytosine1402-N4)-methyltransferase
MRLAQEGEMMSNYHTPVMLQECIDGLAIKPEGTYVDVTFGGGGHSREIMKRLGKDGRLLAFDQDVDAQQNKIDDSRFEFIDQNFRYLKNFTRLHDAVPVDGILADLGVSSFQFDQAERDFSIRFDAELDMRMNQASDLSAKEVVNNYAEADLHKIFGMYGEIQNSKSLAKTIVTARLNAPINTVADLKNAIQNLIPRGKENKYLAQVFQALRIEVNQELEALKDFLTQSAEVLATGGRLVVMSYHSLEDRLVKNFIAKGKFSGEVEKDFYGNDQKPFDAVSRGAITATDEEIQLNNRARSAKLRIAVKK